MIIPICNSMVDKKIAPEKAAVVLSTLVNNDKSNYASLIEYCYCILMQSPPMVTVYKTPSSSNGIL